MGWLSQTEKNNLMGSIHWGENVPRTPEKLSEFISKKENKGHCEKEGKYLFLYFKDKADYVNRFGVDKTVSVLGSRPGLYIYRSSKRKGLKIGQSERLHERMDDHCNKPKDPDPIGGNPGVVILKWFGTRSSDEFNCHEMRKLCEVLINRFMEDTTGKYDHISEKGPRVAVGKKGCNQAIELMYSLILASKKHSQFSDIAKVTASATSKVVEKILVERGAR